METDCDSLSNDSAANFRSRSNTLPAKLLQANAIATVEAKAILGANSRASNVHNTLLAQTLLHNVKAELLLHSGTNVPTPNGNGVACARPVKPIITADGELPAGCAHFDEAQTRLVNPHTLLYPIALNGNSVVHVGPANGNGAVPAHADRSPAACLPVVYDESTAMCESEAYMVNNESPAVRNGSGPTKMKPARRNAWGNASYADLITQAIESSPEKRLTLSQIYDWMVRNVDYFKDKGEQNSSAGWKNSIRHNLSLHARFVRVQNEQTGKISYWTVNYEAIRRERDSVASGASTPRSNGSGSGRRRAATLDAAEYDKTKLRTKLRRRPDASAKLQRTAALQVEQQLEAGLLNYDSSDSQPIGSPQQTPLNHFESLTFDATPATTGIQPLAVHGIGINGRVLGGTVVQPVSFVSNPYRCDPVSSSAWLRSGHIIDEERHTDPNCDDAVRDAVANEEALWHSMHLELANAQHSPLSTGGPPNFASARSTPLQSVSAATAHSPLLSSAHSINGIPSQTATTTTLARPGSHGSLVNETQPVSNRFVLPQTQAYQTTTGNAYVTYSSSNAHFAYGTPQYAFGVNPAQCTTTSPNARLHSTYSLAHSHNPSPQRTPNCESPVQAICSAARSFLTLDSGPRSAVLNDNPQPNASDTMDGLVLVGDGGTACLYALPVTGATALGVSDFQTVQFSGSTNPDGFRVLFDSGPPAAQRCVPQSAMYDFAARRYDLSESQQDLPAQPSPVLRAALMSCTNAPLQFTFATSNESSCVASNQPPSACATSFVYAASNMRGNTANVQLLTDSNGHNFLAATDLSLSGLAVVDGDTNAHAPAPTMLKTPVPLGPRSSVDAIEPSLPFALSSSSIPLPSSTTSEMHFF